MKNIDIVNRILGCCEEIEVMAKYYGGTAFALKSHSVFRNAVSMCLFQIGCMAAQLTDGFHQTHHEECWLEAASMNDLAAYRYDIVDLDEISSKIHDFIPFLRECCEVVLGGYYILQDTSGRMAEGFQGIGEA